MSAAFLTASKMSTMLSATGSTKHAESWPSGRPAFISVGELGRNFRLVISSKKRSDSAAVSAALSKLASAAATASETRRNICSTVSHTCPFWSLAR